MSSPSNTTAKSPTPSDRAALAQAVKLIAGKPGMSPASALRKAGIKSASKIKHLSVELRRQQADRGQRKTSDAWRPTPVEQGPGYGHSKGAEHVSGRIEKGCAISGQTSEAVRTWRRNDGTIGRRAPR